MRGICNFTKSYKKQPKEADYSWLDGTEVRKKTKDTSRHLEWQRYSALLDLVSNQDEKKETGFEVRFTYCKQPVVASHTFQTELWLANGSR